MLDFLEGSSQNIGGPNKIIEIDESKIGRRKYNRGHPVQGQAVFGGVELPPPTSPRDSLHVLCISANKYGAAK